MVVGSTLVASRVPAAAYATGALAAMALQGAGLALPTLWLVLPLRARRLPRGRHRARHEERPRAHAHPRARARRAARPGVGGLQRRAQRGGAGRAGRGGLLVAAIGARWTLLLGRRPADAGRRGGAGACSGRAAASPAAGEPSRRRRRRRRPRGRARRAWPRTGRRRRGGRARRRSTSPPRAAATPIEIVTGRSPGRASNRATRARSATSRPSPSVVPASTMQELLAAEAVDQLERAQLLAQHVARRP